MGNEPPKVRFVKCPRCNQILPESANIPVYKCGGCDLTLRAKHVVAVGSTRTEEPYGKIKPAQIDVGLMQKIESINYPKENSSDTSSNSGDNNEATESSSQKDGLRHISLDSESIVLIGKEESISVSANVIERGPTTSTNPKESSLKNELDYKLENHDNVASSNELLPPSPSEVTTSPDFAIRDEFRPSNHSVGDHIGSFDVLGMHEKEELAQIGEQRTKDQGSNYEKSLRNARISHEVTVDGKNSASISDHSSQATQVRYSPDNDKNLNLPPDAVQKLYTEKMDDAESVISEEAMDSKFDGALDNLSKSHATISSRAYYSSLSSNGDDSDISVPVRSRNVHLSRRTGVRPPKGAVTLQTDSPGKEARKSKITANSTEVPPVRKMASISSYDQYGTALSHYSDWNQDEQFGSRHANGFPAHGGTSTRDIDSSQSRMEVDRSGASRFLDKIPPYPENLTSIHHNGNVSDQSQDLELMRKVQNLRDELSRLTIERRRFEAKFSGVSSDQEPLPAHHGLYYPLHPYGTYGSRTGQQSRSSQLRFAGSSNMRHHLECSCSHVCSDDWQCQSQLPCDACYSRVLHYACPASVSNHSYSPSTSGKHRHADRSFSPTFHNHNMSAFSETRHPGPDMERLYRKQKDRKVRHCRSIAGAAPFITCYKCWKLLQLPADFLLASRRIHKLQCGACLNVLTFSLLGKNHVVPYSSAHDNYGSRAFDNGVDNGPQTSPGDVVSFSDEYNRSFGKSCSTEDHPVVKAQRSDPDKGMANTIHAPSTSTKPVDKVNHTSESAAISMSTASKIVSEYGKLIKLKNVEQRSNSPLHRLMGYNSASEVINCPSNDPNSLSHVTVQNGPEEYLAGEMTIRNRPKLTNHADAKSENRDLEIEMNNEKPTKLNKIRDSSINGHVKKGTEDMNHRLGSTGRKLYVNGRVILDHARKRAEEKAGPIHPGNYWYDYRAGFWGVMGKPCLGIIPPYIKEFGYPMAIDCAGGNTGVLVNGRELHEEDLELLATIGFPTERNKVYTVNATGRINDEDIGEEIGILDNFAPNIEKTGHGFGMLDPFQNTSN